MQDGPYNLHNFWKFCSDTVKMLWFFYIPCSGMSDMSDLGGRERFFTKDKLSALRRFTKDEAKNVKHGVYNVSNRCYYIVNTCTRSKK